MSIHPARNFDIPELTVEIAWAALAGATPLAFAAANR